MKINTKKIPSKIQSDKLRKKGMKIGSINILWDFYKQEFLENSRYKKDQ